ncbi:type II toxin-antitoxin system RelE/ParE family toxin [Rossellomorea marisflavi]|uniref:type II toxin-antitoxin system RelE/ParE family toxin n=1 Tax=Rossellomorea marisflavi TaxID=189381 RepID=UPI00345AAF46
MLYNSEEFPSLLLSEEVHATIHMDTRIQRNPKLLRKIFRALGDLDNFGTDPDYHPKGNLENLGGGWWSLRIRYQKDYWRIMFRKATSNKYGLSIMYLKKDNKIPKLKLNAANRVAKREGWL